MRVCMCVCACACVFGVHSMCVCVRVHVQAVAEDGLHMHVMAVGGVRKCASMGMAAWGRLHGTAPDRPTL